MNKNEWKQVVIVGIILLFIGVCVVPGINAQNDKIFPKAFYDPDKEVSITILHYKVDGTVEKSVVSLSRNQVITLQRELARVKDGTTSLSLYKEYHLIPQNVTDEDLRLGMVEKARRIGPHIEKMQHLLAHMGSRSNHTLKNFNCQVDGFFDFGARLLGGLSFFTSILNGYLYRYHLWDLFLPSVDVFQVNFGYLGFLRTYNGTLPDSQITGVDHASFLVGFVGYYISTTPTFFFTVQNLYHGYAVACLGFVGAPAR